MISCNQYDYIEIACLYRLAVRLNLKDGRSEVGTATDTLRDDQRRECIALTQAEGNGDTKLVPLDDIESMQALVANCHFDLIDFTK